MLLTKKYLKAYQKNRWVAIPKTLEKELLQEYGQLTVDDEGRVHDYTEQDICEQLRKRIL